MRNRIFITYEKFHHILSLFTIKRNKKIIIEKKRMKFYDYGAFCCEFFLFKPFGAFHGWFFFH